MKQLVYVMLLRIALVLVGLVSAVLLTEEAHADVLATTTLAYPIANGFSEILDPTAKSSCEVFKNRIYYALIRSEQNRRFVQGLKDSGKPLSSEEFAKIKLLILRDKSGVPGIGKLNRQITITWDLSNFPHDEFNILVENLPSSRKAIKLAGLIWETGLGGGIPDDLTLSMDRQTHLLKLVYLTNPVDACLGETDVELVVESRAGLQLDFTSQLPRN